MKETTLMLILIRLPGLSAYAAFILILVWLPGLSAYAETVCLRKGMHIHQQHHYTDAVRTLYDCLYGQPVDKASRTSVQLAMGMACLSKARLYKALNNSYLEMLQEYLERLSEQEKHSENASRLIKLYRGKTRMAVGDFKAATMWLDAFGKTADLSEAFRTQALADLGTTLSATGNFEDAAKVWQRVDDTSFSGRALMAAAYCRTKPLADEFKSKINTFIAETGKDDTFLSHQDAATKAHLLTVLSRFGTVEQALSFALKADLGQYAVEERLADNKRIRFYDPFVFADLAYLYGRAAVWFLEQARRTDTGTSTDALTLYYLGHADNFMNRSQEAAEAWQSFFKVSKDRTIPAELLQRAQVCLTTVKSDPSALTSLYSKNNSNGVFALDEALRHCARRGTACPQLVEKVREKLRTVGSADKILLLRSRGKYDTALGNTSQAIEHLEAGRDKARKNRIEANPPEMLIDLVTNYYRNKQYSESLEILFEMAKQFPAVRRIQAALQGIYAMDQQSAGDAKLF